MKLDINDKLIKTIENRCKHFVAPGDICEIQDISISFIEGVWYTFSIGYGSCEPNKKWYNVDITLSDRDASIDFICGMIAQTIFMSEVDE